MLSYFSLSLIGYRLLAPYLIQEMLDPYWAVLMAAWIVLTVGVM